MHVELLIAPKYLPANLKRLVKETCASVGARPRQVELRLSDESTHRSVTGFQCDVVHTLGTWCVVRDEYRTDSAGESDRYTTHISTHPIAWVYRTFSRAQSKAVIVEIGGVSPELLVALGKQVGGARSTVTTAGAAAPVTDLLTLVCDAVEESAPAVEEVRFKMPEA